MRKLLFIALLMINQSAFGGGCHEDDDCNGGVCGPGGICTDQNFVSNLSLNPKASISNRFVCQGPDGQINVEFSFSDESQSSFDQDRECNAGAGDPPTDCHIITNFYELKTISMNLNLNQTHEMQFMAKRLQKRTVDGSSADGVGFSDFWGFYGQTDFRSDSDKIYSIKLNPIALGLNQAAYELYIEITNDAPPFTSFGHFTASCKPFGDIP